MKTLDSANPNGGSLFGLAVAQGDSGGDESGDSLGSARVFFVNDATNTLNLLSR